MAASALHDVPVCDARQGREGGGARVRAACLARQADEACADVILPGPEPAAAVAPVAAPVVAPVAAQDELSPAASPSSQAPQMREAEAGAAGPLAGRQRLLDQLLLDQREDQQRLQSLQVQRELHWAECEVRLGEREQRLHLRKRQALGDHMEAAAAQMAEAKQRAAVETAKAATALEAIRLPGWLDEAVEGAVRELAANDPELARLAEAATAWLVSGRQVGGEVVPGLLIGGLQSGGLQSLGDQF